MIQRFVCILVSAPRIWCIRAGIEGNVEATQAARTSAGTSQLFLFLLRAYEKSFHAKSERLPNWW
jgi:hypothetical protein